ncbi:valine--pyruvate transaminase [Neisseria montereyensis]|uniref:Putative 8-amino-7-oxononanoate synthase n=1 Tax=Neisseria montereyensis TaxID=2973938 RepID=A0ABT2FEZ7_9NEIS|nr:valine--pyruvate transaminase [Neisseria montereyensis]MCS4534728.1 valine--pyruvate transaminase [Neisseria montereyensis]
MQFSAFGQKFTRMSGILQLMDDLGKALSSDHPVNMLGGGNPAHIDEANKLYHQILQELVDNHTAEESIGNYSTPQGDARFIDTLVDFFNREYGWGITSENIALTNGSQNAFFYLFNLFGGRFEQNGTHTDKTILLPLVPEYVGYADTQIEGQHFTTVKPHIDIVEHEGESGFFKYRVDFDTLENLPELKAGNIGAICCSRPTNPSGNVLTDEEMDRLDKLAQTYGIPLIIDNAYGMPFPNIIYSNTTLTWHENIILCFSLSKIGLPGIRTGIIVAAPEVVNAISALNAIVNLAPTRFGAAIATPLIQDGRLKTLSDNTVRPFYQQQAKLAISLIKKEFADYPVRIHKPEGAIFLWLWFEGLPVSTQELYEQLKAEDTLVIPGEHFFIGIDTDTHPHTRECIRISIAQNETVLSNGIAAIGKAVRRLYDNVG